MGIKIEPLQQKDIEFFYCETFEKEFSYHIDKNSKEKSDRKYTLIAAMKPIFILAQFFGHMPFKGVTSLNYEDFSFDCASIRFIVSILLKFFSTIEFILVSYKFVSDGLQFDHTLYFLLNGGGIFLELYLIVLASNWSENMKFWCECEKVFSSNLYHGRKFFEKFRRKLIILSVIFIGYGVLNNYLEVAAGVYRIYLRNEKCNRTVDESLWNVTAKIIKSSRTTFYQYTGFSAVFLILFDYYYNSVRIIWTISAMIVIGFAMNLSIKFEQFTDRLRRTRPSSINKMFWNEVHWHYVAICNLVDKTNDMLAPIVISITFFDFFFLCERIYRQFSEEYALFESINLSAVLTFITVRCLVFLHVCSNVNHYAGEPMEFLRNAPYGTLCDDYFRLVQLVESRSQSISGFGLFDFSKSFIVSFFGVVSTYQLFALQQLDDDEIKRINVKC